MNKTAVKKGLVVLLVVVVVVTGVPFLMSGAGACGESCPAIVMVCAGGVAVVPAALLLLVVALALLATSRSRVLRGLVGVAPPRRPPRLA